MFHRHPILSVVTFAYLGLVAWITLGPPPRTGSDNSLLWTMIGFFAEHRFTSWLTYSRVEFLANVAMFVPIGLFFLLLFGRRLWIVAVLASAGLTVAIESVQLFLPERVSDLRDIVANSVGGLVGVLLALALTAGSARRAKARKVARERELTARSRVRV
ncbi:VanZ family protein [Planctomonas psychrotolerans]|uniref:VanZ family protein n=1 Tax=Planctomonas psychrotolerans TaxID=2528712 RepID=UPI001D0CFBB9|nr:VanZ family protein [Planctomonas psychrotolerans]